MAAFQKRFEAIQVSAVEGLGAAAIQNIVGELDTLRAEIDRTIAALDLPADDPTRVALEAQRNAIIAKRNELQTQSVALGHEEALTTKEITEEGAKQVATGLTRVQTLQLQGKAIEDAARGALQLADAFGIIDDRVADVLTSLVQVGRIRRHARSV